MSTYPEAQWTRGSPQCRGKLPHTGNTQQQAPWDSHCNVLLIRHGYTDNSEWISLTTFASQLNVKGQIILEVHEILTLYTVFSFPWQTHKVLVLVSLPWNPSKIQQHVAMLVDIVVNSCWDHPILRPIHFNGDASPAHTTKKSVWFYLVIEHAQ